MSWLTRLFKKERKVLDDPVFGRIEFERCIWATTPEHRRFDFMLLIDAPDSGPTDGQRSFLGEFLARRALFESAAKAYIASDDHAVDVAKLRLYAVEIEPEDKLQKGTFALEFAGDDEIEIHRVVFEDNRPTCYGVDD